VAVAGVLLVFTFLVVPAATAFMFSERLSARIGLAWSVGVACSIAGMLVSYFGDLPTGPSVVVCFAGMLIAAAALYYVRGAERPWRAIARVLATALAVSLLALMLSQFRGPPAEHAHATDFETFNQELSSSDENTQIEGVHHLAELGDPHAVSALVRALDRSTSDRLAEHIVQVLPQFGDAAAGVTESLERLAKRTDDPFLLLSIASTRLRLEDPAGFMIIAALLADEPPLLVEQKAGELLEEMAGDDFGIGKGGDEAARAESLDRFHQWLTTHGKDARWRPNLRRFD
jgi:hypothetical protein